MARFVFDGDYAKKYLIKEERLSNQKCNLTLVIINDKF